MDRPSGAIVVLGAGYTGGYMLTQARELGRSVFATSRSPRTNLHSMPEANRIEFDLQRQETWRNVPPDADLIWCFPAVPEESVKACAEQVFTKGGRLVVIGSASAYEVGEKTGPAPIIDESSPIDLNRPRVRGEEYLRVHHKSIILRVAGIYGPGRNVLDWIRNGKAGPSHRYVNLVHVEDLAAICLLALERGRPEEIYNVSDGQPRRWIDICQEVGRRWGIESPKKTVDAQAGKHISNIKLKSELGYTFRHPDLYEALETIERSRSLSE